MAPRFGILGSLEAHGAAGRPVDLGRPKQRALLAVLLLEANRVVSVDRLIGLMWPDEPPPRAMGSLHGYLSNLRRALDPQREARVPGGIIVTRAPGYLLRVEPDDVDAARFERLLAEGQRLLGAGEPGPARDALVEALGLWRGPALADFAHEPFATAAANRLEELRLVAVEDRLDADLALGPPATAAAELEALVAAHPLRERLWGLLMLALYRAGRQAEALRAYQAARNVLANELGLEPGPALRAMEGDILAQAPSLELRARPGPEPGAASVSRAVPADEPPAEGASLVGREAQVAALDAALDRARRGRGSIVVVSGEPGIGKTRLAEEAAARAVAAGAEVAWGRCHDGAAPAFWPWMQVVRALVARFDPAEVRAAVGSNAADLAQVFPEVGARLGVPPGAGAPQEADRFRSYQALADLLAGLAAVRPVVVVLDDVHWADAASLELVGFLAPTFATVALLVIATYRNADVTGRHPLSRTLAALAHHAVVDLGVLEGLPPADVGALVAAELGRAPGVDLVDAVYARTDGNPFFVVELVRLLESNAVAGPVAGTGALVPARVRDVLRDRLGRLPEGTNALLEVAAVAGRDLELDVLAGAGGLDDDEVASRLEVALVSGLVVDRPDGGGYRFSHALVQDAIYDQLNAMRRARLHGRVAEALEALHGADDNRVAEIGAHFAAAAAVGGRAKAFEYTLRAADSSHARLAYEQAQELLLRALDLLASLPAGRQRDEQELGVQLRLAGWTTGTEGFTGPTPAKAWTRAAELSRHVGDMSQVLGALWGQWVFSLMRGDSAGTGAVAGQLSDLAAASGDPAVGLAAAVTQSYGGVHRGDHAAGLSHGDAAVALGAGFDDGWIVDTFHVHLVVLVLSTSCWSAWYLGDAEGAARRAGEAIDLATKVGHPFSTAAALVGAGVLGVLQGDIAGVRGLGEAAVELASKHGIPSYVAFGRVLRGWAIARQGEPEAGTAELEAALGEIDRAGWVLQRTTFLGLLADARRACGRMEDALAAADQALAAAEAYGERYWEADLRRMRDELVAAESS